MNLQLNRQLSRHGLKIAAVVALTTGLAACGGKGDDTASAPETSTTASTTSAKPAPGEDLPTAQELKAILDRAVDPNLPTEKKLDTVVNGEKAPQLFDALTQSKQQSHAELEVEEPVLPGVLPNMAEAPVTLKIPERDPQLVQGVEFVNENGKWKLDKRWACTLVRSALPEQVPPMCEEEQ